MIATENGPCKVCGGIWFWSEFSAGALKCIECVPPPQSPKRGPGIIQHDGSLLTADAVTAHIQDTIRRCRLQNAVKALGEGWTLVKKPGLVIQPHEIVIAQAVRVMNDVPIELIIHPGDPQWVAPAVIERAIAAQRQVVQTATGRVEGVKSEIVGSQAKRAARNPPRSAKKES